MTKYSEKSEIFLTDRHREITKSSLGREFSSISEGAWTTKQHDNTSSPNRKRNSSQQNDLEREGLSPDIEEEKEIPLSSQNVYLKACEKLHITPSTSCLRYLTDTSLVIPYHGVGHVGAKAVAIALVQNTTVTRLDLSNNCLGQTGLFYILEMLQANQVITDLNLADNDLLSVGARMLSTSLRKNKTITRLDISGNGFKENDAVHIAKLLKRGHRLQELHLSHNTFREQGGIVLGKALESNYTLKKLDLSWNHLRQLGAVAVCSSIAENKTLESLDLSWNGCGMEGCHEMGKALLRNQSLTYLDLSANRVSLDAFRQLLRGVVNNNKLKTLKVGNNPITTDGAYAILQSIAVSESNLQEIDLKDISVDNDFVELLHQVQKNRPLICFYGNTLRHDEIKKGNIKRVLDTDDPITVLFEYMKQKNLRLIDLLHNLDRDHSDTISREEFQQGLSTIDLPLSGRSLDILMKKLDKNQDGSVDYEELSARHKEYVRRVTKLRLQADLGPSHYKGFDKLEQLREAVRLKISLNAFRGSQ